MNASDDDNLVNMDVFKVIELLAAVFLTGLALVGLWQVTRRKPFGSVSNARKLVFLGGMLSAMIYFWVKFFTALGQ